MKLLSISSFLIISVLASCSTQPGLETSEKSLLNYPETRKDTTVTDDYFGTLVADPYRWLEDENSAETNAWVDAQNLVTNSYLSEIPYRDSIRKRLTEVWNYEKVSAPGKEKTGYFQFRNDGIQNQSVLYFMDHPDSTGTILLDPNKFSEAGTTALTDFTLNNDGTLAVYGTSDAGSDWKEFKVIKVPSGETLSDHIQWVKFSGAAWKGDGFFYSRFDKPVEGQSLSGKNLNSLVFYHKLGTKQDKDISIYRDQANPERNFYAMVTDDEKYLIISESETTSGNSLLIKDLSKENNPVVRMTEGFDSDFSVIDHVNGQLIIRTNHNAPRYRLMAADPNNPGISNWTELVPQKDMVLESVSLMNGKMILKYMKDVTNRLYTYSLTGEELNEIKLPELGVVSSIKSKKDDNEVWFSFRNFTSPGTIYYYNDDNSQLSVFHEPELDFDLSSYETRQVFYKGKDGKRIPMFITHKKGIEKTRSNPVLLYGYGGFNISITPSFSPATAVFLEKGGIYAVANIRGGGEYGKEWHEAGMQFNKQNVFDDFISAAEYLINEGFTNPSKIAITGRSNGGLLIGAVMTQRPDLFAVAVPQVGVLDMLRYHEFTIGRAWSSDYGLSEDERHFQNLYRYSPLHNLKETAYPATMVMTGDHDDRVVPAHSYKFAATLQEKNTGEEPVLIRIDRQAGHGAGKPVSMQIDEATDLWSFIFHELGMDWEEKAEQ